MKVTVQFEDDCHVYTVDFMKLAKVLNITEQQIRQAVSQEIAKT